MAEYRSDDLNKGIGNLNLSDSSDEASSDFSYEGEKEDYYIHIDILTNFRKNESLVPRRINQFMVERDCFDPRKGTNFPTDLMDGNETCTTDTRRRLMGRGEKYYELWKVRKDFDIGAFDKMVREFHESVEVRVVTMIGSDHQIYVFNGEKIEM